MNNNTNNNTNTYLTTESRMRHNIMRTVWLVVTTPIGNDQKWLHVERFDSKAEALNWMKWT